MVKYSQPLGIRVGKAIFSKTSQDDKLERDALEARRRRSRTPSSARAMSVVSCRAAAGTPLTPEEQAYLRKQEGRLSSYRASILILTFVTYALYHMSRRPLSIAKKTLGPECNLSNKTQLVVNGTSITNMDDADCPQGWKPFDDPESGTELLGLLDSCFLFSYAIGMFGSGWVAERVHLRYFLTGGLLSSSLFICMFGIGYYANIHSVWFYALIQVASGLASSTGWPAVVSAVGNWFQKGTKRGVIFGIWNSHTNIGNIIGASLAGYFLNYNWGLAFIAPSIVIAIFAIFIFMFLTPYPEEVHLIAASTFPVVQCNLLNGDHTHHHAVDMNAAPDCGSNKATYGSIENEQDGNDYTTAKQPARSVAFNTECILNGGSRQDLVPPSEYSSSVSVESGDSAGSVDKKEAVAFWDALKVPGVIEFSLCLFFSKLVSYTFLYWLPYYINSSTSFGSTAAAYMCTPFDMGGIVGGILAGYVRDKTHMSATICILMFLIGAPMIYIYKLYGSLTFVSNVVLQVICGLFVNGPYALITTAVSAELGDKVGSDSHALATISAIIDGTGSVGAAVGPMVASLVLDSGWSTVFILMISANVAALFSLLRIGINEWKRVLGSGSATQRSVTQNGHISGSAMDNKQETNCVIKC